MLKSKIYNMHFYYKLVWIDQWLQLVKYKLYYNPD